MRTVLWNLLALVVGVVVGTTVNMSLIQLNVSLFPGPAGFDVNDPEQLKAYLANMPALGFVLPMLAHVSQSFFGGGVAALLAGSRPMFWAMVLGVLTLLGSLVMLMMYPGPWWMWMEVPGNLVAAYLAGGLAISLRSRVWREADGEA